MRDNKRRCLSFFIALFNGHEKTKALYDYSESDIYLFSSKEIDHNCIAIYDHTEFNYLIYDGTNLYDIETSSYITISINRNSFMGCDLETNECFEGEIDGNRIAVFDFEKNECFFYSIM